MDAAYQETVNRAFEAMQNAAVQAYKDNCAILRSANEFVLSQVQPGGTVPERITSMGKVPADFSKQYEKVKSDAIATIDAWAEDAKSAIRKAMVQPVPEDAANVLSAWASRPSVTEDELKGLAESYPDNLQVIQSVNSYAEKSKAKYRAEHPALSAMGRIDRACEYARSLAGGYDADSYMKDAYENIGADMHAAASGEAPKSFINRMGYELAGGGEQGQ